MCNVLEAWGGGWEGLGQNISCHVVPGYCYSVMCAPIQSKLESVGERISSILGARARRRIRVKCKRKAVKVVFALFEKFNRFSLI
jgi:hypothetical protein